MNTRQIKLSPEEGKLKAWKLRQRDTAWGRAIAQGWIPFYALYYAITRRTITPWLYALGLGFAVGVLAGAFKEKEGDYTSNLVAYALSPIAFKLGGDSARDFAKGKLKEAGEEQ